MRSRPSRREARSTGWLIEYSLDVPYPCYIGEKIIHSIEKATLKSNSLVMFKTADVHTRERYYWSNMAGLKSSLELMKP